LAQEGIKAIISDPEVIDICYDKYKTYEFCKKNGIPAPATYLWSQIERFKQDYKLGLVRFPLIAKPRKGSRSVGVYFIEDMKHLLDDVERVRTQDKPEDEKVMYQEYIDSEQYSIHVFNDSSLKPVCVVTMVNIFRHFGETFHIKTYRDSALTQLGIKIGEKLGHFGPLSADVHQRENGEYVILEFNPRISGCYSLSHYAGADFPGKIFSLIKNEPIKYDRVDAFEDNVIMLKQFTTYKTTEALISEIIE
jgi:carbamoyl-phosphate synthase large subunit